jgi:hypothetical protein
MRHAIGFAKEQISKAVKNDMVVSTVQERGELMGMVTPPRPKTAKCSGPSREIRQKLLKCKSVHIPSVIRISDNVIGVKKGTTLCNA